MPLAVRIWPVEFKPGVPIGDWGPLRYVGSDASDAPWRYEPAYWLPGRVLEAAQDPTYHDHVAWEFDLPIEAVRELDASFLQDDPSRSDPELGRALAHDSPFTVFRIMVFEWESGLPD